MLVPAAMNEFAGSALRAAALAAVLADRPVSADELQRAKQPMVEASIQAPQGNGHWAYWLPCILNDERMKGAMLNETAVLKAVTAEQVQALFRDRLVGRAPLEVVSRARRGPVGEEEGCLA